MSSKDETSKLLDPFAGADSNVSSYESNKFFQNLKNKRYKLQFRRRKRDKDGATASLNAVEFALKTLHEQVPSVCIMGMGRLESIVEDVAVDRSADMVYAGEHKGSDPLHTLKGEVKLHRLYEKQQIIDVVLNSVMDEIEEQKHTSPLQRAIFVAFLAQILVGYNIGILNASPYPLVSPSLHQSTLALALIVSGLAAGGVLGTAVADLLAEITGRRFVLIVSSVLFAVGGLLQTFVMQSLRWIILARALIGLASGLLSVTLPTYLGELCPPGSRGKVGNLLQYATATGLLLSFVMPLIFRPASLFFLHNVLTSILGFALIIMCPTLVESPSWILSRDAQSPRARTILAKLRGTNDAESIEHEAFHLISTYNIRSDDKRGLSCWSNVIPSDSEERKMTILYLVLQMMQQASGVYAVFYYSSSLLKSTTNKTEFGIMLIGLTNLLAIIVGAYIGQRMRPLKNLLLFSCWCMAICWVVLTLALSGNLMRELALPSLLVMVVAFEIGLGHIPGLLLVEHIDASSVRKVLLVGTQLNWLIHFIVAITFPFLQKCVGPYSFLFFALGLGTAGIYASIVSPKTQGKTARKLYIDLTAQRPVESMHVDY